MAAPTLIALTAACTAEARTTVKVSSTGTVTTKVQNRFSPDGFWGTFTCTKSSKTAWQCDAAGVNPEVCPHFTGDLGNGTMELRWPPEPHALRVSAVGPVTQGPPTGDKCHHQIAA
jgi:hypothetical protein